LPQQGASFLFTGQAGETMNKVISLSMHKMQFGLYCHALSEARRIRILLLTVEIPYRGWRGLGPRYGRIPANRLLLKNMQDRI
jgi:hypothetical protein